MENCNVEEVDRRNSYFFVDLAEAFEKVLLRAVWALGHALRHLATKFLRVLCGYFQHQRKVLFEGCVADPLQTVLSRLEMVSSALQDCEARCDE